MALLMKMMTDDDQSAKSFFVNQLLHEGDGWWFIMFPLTQLIPVSHWKLLHEYGDVNMFQISLGSLKNKIR